jgi:hypothetical protein
MKKIKKKQETIRDTAHLHKRLIELSIREGGAWSFAITPFSHEVTFFGADSPSKLPDYLLAETRGMGDYPKGRLAYKGKLQGFSEAAYLREQNRGIGGDR